MKTRLYAPEVARSSPDTPAPERWRSRPFESREAETAVNAGAVGHHFGQIRVLGDTEQVQRSPAEAASQLTYVINTGKAYLLDPTQHFQHLKQKGAPPKIPLNTQVTLLATQTMGKQTYAQVRWTGGEGWVRHSHLTAFDLTYATRFGEGKQQGKELSANKKQNLRYESDAEAKQSFIAAQEAKSLGKILGRVKDSRTIAIDPMTHEPTGDKLPQGSKVVIREVQQFDQKSYTKVMDMEGNEFWVESRHITPIDPRIYQAGLIQGNELDTIRNPQVVAALQQSYLSQVDALLSTKKFTSQQHELLETAKGFAQDPEAQSKLPNLEIPDALKREDNCTLNEDLIDRINRFYKFLAHKQLIRGASPVSGVRAFNLAHELSTRWMLNPDSKVLESFNHKLEFVRQLVEIGGRDQTANVDWATTEQVKQLKALLKRLDDNQSGGEQPDTGEPDPKKELERIVAEIMKQHGTQKAQASEGYPKGDARRKPNIRETGISLHCGGEAIDIFFDFTFNYYDPIVDAMAAMFGLQRSVKDSAASPEHWHYERLGIALGDRITGEEAHLEK